MPRLKEITEIIFGILTIWFGIVFMVVMPRNAEHPMVMTGFVLGLIILFRTDIMNILRLPKNSFFRSKIFQKFLEMVFLIICVYVTCFLG